MEGGGSKLGLLVTASGIANSEDMNPESTAEVSELSDKSDKMEDIGGKSRGELSGDRAARQGSISVIEERSSVLEFSTRAMDSAAGAGHLNVVKWLHDNRTEGCTSDAFDLAAAGGHLDVIWWLHENRTEGFTKAALNGAAANGHKAVVEWLIQSTQVGDVQQAAQLAEENDHTEIMDYLRSSGSMKRQRRSGPGKDPDQPPADDGPMGMFGTPFPNFVPWNGVPLPPGSKTLEEQEQAETKEEEKELAAAAAAAPTPVPPAQAPPSRPPTAPVQRLRGNLLRSPEMTLATTDLLNVSEQRQLKAVMEFRRAYSSQSLEGSTIPKDPFTLFAVWFEESRIARVSEPGAMCLSTVSPTGRPSARYVMLQGFDKRGFVWYTNFESRKSQDITHNPYAALSFWWSELQRAVRIEGVVSKVSERESTEYFMSRPRGSQVGAWALHQSRPVESRGTLERNVKEVQEKFKEQTDVPRPPHFGGYRLQPDRMEFWKGRQSRIHDRIIYVMMDDKWRMQRLQP